MARFARLIIYEGSEYEITKQITQSLPEGFHDKGRIKISVINLSTETVLPHVVKDIINDKELKEVML